MATGKRGARCENPCEGGGRCLVGEPDGKLGAFAGQRRTLQGRNGITKEKGGATATGPGERQTQMICGSGAGQSGARMLGGSLERE